MSVLSDPVSLDVSAMGEVLDAAVATDVPQTTFLLGSDGSFWRADHRSGEVKSVASVELPALPENKPWGGKLARHRLHVSPSGRFFAVVVDYGRFGTVIDTDTGRTTLSIDGGEYHPETVPLSAVFATHDGREVIIHRTDWNRLDASDAETGRLLTERGPTSYKRGEERPPNYLDYFHGGLYLSPDGSLILDDGWVWHPVGVPRIWSVTEWLGSNVWESEAGPSRFIARGLEDWDYGPCWLDDDRFALPGIGDPDRPALEAVGFLIGAAVVRYSELLSQASDQEDFYGEHASDVPGPEGRLYGHDDLLFAVTPSAMAVWDVGSGERLEEHEAFSPTVLSRADRRLTEVRDGALVSRTY